MDNLPYGEEINYWMTSRSDPDTWIAKARKQIETIGGQIIAEAFGQEATTGKSAFMLTFSIQDELYKIIWPVLPTKGKDKRRAAKIQAATMLYHDVKAKCISSRVLGPRAVFFSFFVLPDGRTMGEIPTPELGQIIPNLFALPEKTNGGRYIDG